MGTAAQRAWGAYYVVAGFMAFGGLAHTQAGGNGQWVCLSGFALLVSLGAYDAFHVERFARGNSSGYGPHERRWVADFLALP